MRCILHLIIIILGVGGGGGGGGGTRIDQGIGGEVDSENSCGENMY